MDINIEKFTSEIVEFVNEYTLREIDYGVIDLSKIYDLELKNTLYYFVELLEVELRINYHINSTGIFRVHKSKNKYLYEEFGHIIEADSICELRQLVLDDSRIWYIFDEIQAEKILGRQ